MDRVVHKPWGKEEWLELNDSYCYKRIYINAGYKTSYQYHDKKKETNYIIKGKAEVWLENDEGVVEKTIMNEGDFFTVNPPKKHRVIAITDIILQEVSTPEVDDVHRINDEFNRGDGKISAEQHTPAVLILAAGMGNRLGTLTEYSNKAMLNVGGKAIISHVIDSFPSNYDFVIAVGYKGDELQEYCEIAHTDLNMTFVKVDDVEDKGPGYSAWLCKEYLMRPFYMVVADCVLADKVPHLDGNWLGIYPTAYPEKYSTVSIDDKGNILSFVDKSESGYDNAFIGLASIWDFDVFWDRLKTAHQNDNYEVVSAFYDLTSYYKKFSTKKIQWFDTGTLDDLNSTRARFADGVLSLYKNTNEVTYVKDKNFKKTFMKFIPNSEKLLNLESRCQQLNQIPTNVKFGNFFMSYDWVEGDTLYSLDDLNLYRNFYESFQSKWMDTSGNVSYDDALIFYVQKTSQRIESFLQKHDISFDKSYIVNGKRCESMKHYIDKYVQPERFINNPLYESFHGDLQFDNIIYSNEGDFVYIDWRDSFANRTDAGDLYYDIAKLYGGVCMNYKAMKNSDDIVLLEGDSVIDFELPTTSNLLAFKKYIDTHLLYHSLQISFDMVKLITAIIYVNMSPLHDKKFGRTLWFKSLDMFRQLDNEDK